MNIQILNLAVCPNKSKLGDILVQYNEIVIRCELVYHVPTKGAWIRMPEIWLNQNFKKKFVYWPRKDLSDEFQKTVLKLILDEYDLSLDKIAEIYASSRVKKKCVDLI